MGKTLENMNSQFFKVAIIKNLFAVENHVNVPEIGFVAILFGCIEYWYQYRYDCAYWTNFLLRPIESYAFRHIFRVFHNLKSDVKARQRWALSDPRRTLFQPGNCHSKRHAHFRQPMNMANKLIRTHDIVMQMYLGIGSRESGGWNTAKKSRAGGMAAELEVRDGNVGWGFGL